MTHTPFLPFAVKQITFNFLPFIFDVLTIHILSHFSLFRKPNRLNPFVRLQLLKWFRSKMIHQCYSQHCQMLVQSAL